MRCKYIGVEPCRIGAVLVVYGATWDWPSPPDALWVSAEPPAPEPPKYRPKPIETKE